MLFIQRTLTAAALLAGFLFTTSQTLGQTDKEKTDPTGEEDKVYEAIGMMFAQGSGLGKMQFTDKQVDQILAGMKKSITLGKMPPEFEALQPKVQAIMMQKMQLARQAEQAEMAGAAEGNKAKGKEYLSLLSKQEGVRKDPSGFYYEILKKGEGASPTMSNTVRLHYHGTLIDGTVFDSSVDRGQPASFHEWGDQGLLRRVDQDPSGRQDSYLYSQRTWLRRQPPPRWQNQTRRHPDLRMRTA